MNNAASKAPEIFLFALAAIFAIVAGSRGSLPFSVLSIISGLVGQFFRTHRTSPRVISDSERSRLAKEFRTATIPSTGLTVEYEDGDPESTSYAIAIRQAFDGAEIRLNMTSRNLSEPVQNGLTILVRDVSKPPEMAQRLLTAFCSARVPVALEERDSLLPIYFVISTGRKPLIHWKGLLNCIRFRG
jgi:hypothetical protein